MKEPGNERVKVVTCVENDTLDLKEGVKNEEDWRGRGENPL